MISSLYNSCLLFQRKKNLPSFHLTGLMVLVFLILRKCLPVISLYNIFSFTNCILSVFFPSSESLNRYKTKILYCIYIYIYILQKISRPDQETNMIFLFNFIKKRKLTIYFGKLKKLGKKKTKKKNDILRVLNCTLDI